MGRIISRDGSRAFAPVRRDERFGERDISDDDELLDPALLCIFRSWCPGDRDVDLPGLLDFDPFGHRERREERFNILLLRFLELWRFRVFLNILDASDDAPPGGSGTSFLLSFPVSA